jgi:hypothetical protein
MTFASDAGFNCRAPVTASSRLISLMELEEDEGLG